MTLKALATGAAAVAIVGAAAAGVTSLASSASLTAAPDVRAVVFDTPLPLDPPADVPTADQLVSVLNGLATPGVSFRSPAKVNLIEGGIGIIEGRAADRVLEGAVEDGYLPLSFEVTNIVPAGPGAASATVIASGPQLAPTPQNITFVNQGGWKLSRGSATTLLTVFTA